MANLLQTMKSLGPARLGAIAVVAAGLLGFLGFVGDRLTQPPMGLLFSNLDLQESSQIVAKLDAMKVPYRLSGNGTQILVPENQALRLRMSMAEAGLPSGGSVGYEIFDRSDSLGATSFVQNINHTRALEGELARTIRAIDGVQSARVHLVLPRREVFSRESRQPSASIVLRVRGRIDRPQVRAIQNLVAAAVPDLKPSHISIVDDKGNLLASGADDRDTKGAAFGYAEMRAQHEERLRRAIETLLDRTVGAGNARAEVTAEMDFDRITMNSESYDPDGQVVRSTQTVAEQNNSNEGNTPVSVANNLPSAQANGGGAQSQSRNQRNEETVNYEISKTIKTQVREGGTVKRLSVAVAVNGSFATDADGKRTFQARPEDELKQIAALVRSAVGYDEKRGDTVEVVALRFNEPEELGTTGAEPGMFEFGKNDILRLIEVGVLALLTLLALLFVGRPLVTRIFSGGVAAAAGAASLPAIAATAAARGLPAPQGDGEQQALPQIAQQGNPGGAPALAPPQRNNELEQMIDVARIEGQVKASSLKKIGEIVEGHPEEAVAIMRNWLFQGS